MNTDERIERCLAAWEQEESGIRKAFYSALTRHLSPLLYQEVRSRNGEEVVKPSKKLFMRFRRFNKASAHLWWALLWTLKWYLLLPGLKKKEYFIAALGSDRGLSFAYLDALETEAKKRSAAIITLNVLLSARHFFNPSIRYYPRPLYASGNNINTPDWITVKEKAEAAGKEHLEINFDGGQLKKYYEMYRRDARAFANLLQSGLRTALLVQDFDYTSNKALYAQYAREAGVPVMRLDHSLRPYSHLYKHSFSDKLLVWGEYEKEQLMEQQAVPAEDIVVSGRPDPVRHTALQVRDPVYWVYLLTSYDDPAMETAHRSIDHSLEMVGVVEKVMQRYFPEQILLLRPHPNDDFEFFNDRFYNIYTDPLKKIEDQVQIYFVEDSTAAVELLKYKVPVVYISDRSKNDYFHFDRFKSAPILDDPQHAADLIRKAIAQTPDMDARNAHLEYAFGGNKFKDKLSEVITELLPNSK